MSLDEQIDGYSATVREGRLTKPACCQLCGRSGRLRWHGSYVRTLITLARTCLLPIKRVLCAGAIKALREDTATLERFHRSGIPWMGIQIVLEKALPDVLDKQERNKIAHNIVRRAMDEIAGTDKWDTERRPSKSGSGMTTWIVLKKTEGPNG